MDLAKTIYLVSKDFPADEKFGLTSQIRRASVSVPSNIAEGQARGTKEFIHFLNISSGSLAEIETQIILAHQLDFISAEQLKEILTIIDSTHRQLNALINSLRPKVYK